MLYTGKGDDGSSGIFNTKQGRMSKGSGLFEALGCVDELNATLGFARVEAAKSDILIYKERINDILLKVQNTLFTLQSEIAGSDKSINEELLRYIEKVIKCAEDELPDINSFYISGSCELEARLDMARVVTRRAERAVIRAKDNDELAISHFSLAYINRLSSLMYAMARFVNFKNNIQEISPKYE